MPRTPGRCSSRGSGSTRTTPSRRPTRPASTAGPSTGRRCGASTRPTATGTWSARARRPRRSPAEGSIFPLASGAPAHLPIPLHCAAFPRRSVARSSLLTPRSRRRRGPVGSREGEVAIRAGAAAWGWLGAGDGEVVEFGQVRRQAQGDHALLFLGVGAGDDGDRHHVAAVHREVRDAWRDVHEVAGPDHGALHQALAVPDLGLAADGVDSGLVPLVDVRHAPGPGRNRHQVQAQGLGARGPAAHPGSQVHALLAVVAAAGADDDYLSRSGDGAGGCVECSLPYVAYSEHLSISYP